MRRAPVRARSYTRRGGPALCVVCPWCQRVHWIAADLEIGQCAKLAGRKFIVVDDHGART